MESEALEVVENVPKLPLAAVITVAFGGFIMGCTTGYVIAKRVLEPKYAAIAEEEIAEAKEFYKRLNKVGEYATPEEASAALGVSPQLGPAADALRRYQGGDENPPEEPQAEAEIEVIVQSVFDSPELPVWNHEAEVAKRNPDKPYVAHKDEFIETELQQITLTYYAGDQALADERDDPIVDVSATVGTESLERFGHGSEDPKIVYVINEKLGLAFEVIYHEGKFAHEVLGFEHGEKLALHDRRSPRRFRVADE
jgi:hypothetical protein